MKLGTLKKLRTRLLRRRERFGRELDREPLDHMNLFRPRLRGRMEALDGVVDDIDQILKAEHDRLHDRRRK